MPPITKYPVLCSRIALIDLAEHSSEIYHNKQIFPNAFIIRTYQPNQSIQPDLESNAVL